MKANLTDSVKLELVYKNEDWIIELFREMTAKEGIFPYWTIHTGKGSYRALYLIENKERLIEILNDIRKLSDRGNK